MDCIVHGVAKSWARLRDLHFHFLSNSELFLYHVFFFINLKIYFLIQFWLYWVFIAACGLSLVAGSEGYSLVTVPGILIAAASLVAEHKLQGTQASAVVAHGLHQLWCVGLVAPRHMESSQTKAGSHPLHGQVNSSPLDHQGRLSLGSKFSLKFG